MPDKFKAAFNLPMQLPVWSVVSALFLGVFACGMTLQKLNALLDNYEKTAATVATMQAQQMGSIATINNIQMQTQNHETRFASIESRFSVIERNALEKR